METQRAVLSRYFAEVWSQGKVGALDELLAPDYINHSASIPNPVPGPAGLKPIVLAMRRGIPNLRYEILDMVLEPGKAAVFLRVTGTHRDDLFGMPATGQRINVRQMQIEWFDSNHRIWQHWRITDELNMLRQLGQLT